jgi:hypothetical protein
MLPMLEAKRRMNIIKQFGKGDNTHQRFLTSHNFLKIDVPKMLSKVLSMSTCIMAQSKCRLKKV